MWDGLEFPVDKPRRGYSTVHREWAKVLRLDPCAYCGARSGSVDHLTAQPLGKFGDSSLDVPENMVGACLSCNGAKGNARSPLFMLLAVRGMYEEVGAWRPIIGR